MRGRFWIPWTRAYFQYMYILLNLVQRLPRLEKGSSFTHFSVHGRSLRGYRSVSFVNLYTYFVSRSVACTVMQIVAFAHVLHAYTRNTCGDTSFSRFSRFQNLQVEDHLSGVSTRTGAKSHNFQACGRRRTSSCDDVRARSATFHVVFRGPLPSPLGP